MEKWLIVFSSIVLIAFLMVLSISVSAKVFVTSYCDVTLEACRSQDQALELIVDKYPYDIEVESIYYFNIYDAESSLAQNALECAKRQGYKEEYKKEIQNNIGDFSRFSREALKEYAEAVGLVSVNFSFCLDTQMTALDVLTEVVVAEDDGVTSAPSIRFNMDLYTGSQTFTSLHELTKQYLRLDGEGKEIPSEEEHVEEQDTEAGEEKCISEGIDEKTGIPYSCGGGATTEETVEEEKITEEQPPLAETKEPLFFRTITQFRAWLITVLTQN